MSQHPDNETLDMSLVAGRYEIQDEIARGGMGTVYRATQVELGRRVALKILRPPPNADDSVLFEKRFRLEAETLAKFDHPNIVRIFDFGGTGSGQLFLAMEYVEGPRFSDLVKDGPMSPAEALPLFVQVCVGLRYAHHRGAIHRDLKPSNVLVKEDGDGRRQVKIVDFGLVKLVDEDQTITREGLILGSPHCMAPEQVQGAEMDHRVDIYALGVLLFRCLTGIYPYQRNNLAATMMAHLNDPVPRLSEEAPDLEMPEGLEELVVRCMQKDPNDRFATVDQLIEQLAQIIELPASALRSGTSSHPSMQSPALQSDRSAPHAPAPGPRARIAVFAASVLVGMLGLIAVVVLGGLWMSTAPVAEGEGPTVPVVAKPAKADEPEEADGVASPAAIPEPAPARVAVPAPRPTAAPMATPKAPAPRAPDPALASDAPAAEAEDAELVSGEAPTDPVEALEEPEKPAPPEGYFGLPDDL